MNAVGGPPTPQLPKPRPPVAVAVFGPIVVEVAGTSRVVERPTQDSHGCFRVVLAPGRYLVVGTPTGNFRSVSALKATVVVRTGTVAQADLAIVMG
jgi:hypothetical protein